MWDVFSVNFDTERSNEKCLDNILKKYSARKYCRFS